MATKEKAPFSANSLESSRIETKNTEFRFSTSAYNGNESFMSSHYCHCATVSSSRHVPSFASLARESEKDEQEEEEEESEEKAAETYQELFSKL